MVEIVTSVSIITTSVGSERLLVMILMMSRCNILSLWLIEGLMVLLLGFGVVWLWLWLGVGGLAACGGGGKPHVGVARSPRGEHCEVDMRLC